MDILYHNPLAEMYGPHFLLLYGIVIGITIAWCHWSLRDRTTNLPVPQIPDNLAPYELAYLRSQEKGMAQLAIARLVKNGYWEIIEKTRLVPVEFPPDIENLPDIEKQAFTSLTSEKSAKEVQQDIVRSLDTQDYQTKLEQQNFLLPQALKSYYQAVVWIGAIAICSLGGYKFHAALHNHHHNVLFLIFFTVVALIWLYALCLFRSSPNTNLGNRYLIQLKTAFEKVKIDDSLEGDRNFSLWIALFGTTQLAQTIYESYEAILTFPLPTSSSSCSGTSGSCGGGCGSGCGGGCGGCGG
ncbi:MAG: TIGR04222 domain-containing membrane protein [Jaaginema sp. PMC 1079.18]|nr:TIGR04222 domain-containing membrane protein [Jaaginema sp. PMC 1080.18]MEC4852442.1 TIGR04222 domain-containing membrane protein [Jaaginema sp. PMC 1079.18]MEC4868494.1 TIGR04222 domain-containing membrane protein [Jaaginema sp. PMC 1078.18]